MEQLERIAARVGRVACSPDNSPEAMLESAALVSELATEFEAVQQRIVSPGDLPIEPPAPGSADLSPEEIERVVREILNTDCA
jgi:hypothetical protein